MFTMYMIQLATQYTGTCLCNIQFHVFFIYTLTSINPSSMTLVLNFLHLQFSSV